MKSNNSIRRVIARTLVASTMMMGVAATASAGSLTLSNFGGGWSGAVDGAGGGACIQTTNAAGNAVDDVRWRGHNSNLLGQLACGLKASGILNLGSTSDAAFWTDGNTSGYRFDPTNASYTFPGSSSPFALGEFTHRNNAIQDAITSVDYDLTFNHNGATPPPNPFSIHFDFTHNETSNPNGDTAVTTVAPLSQVFTVGDDTYLFTLLGFKDPSKPADPYVFNFFTKEGKTSTMTLFASVVQLTPDPPAVPEPGTLLLLGAGLVALGAKLRRRA